jgi:hypothetical protein
MTHRRLQRPRRRWRPCSSSPSSTLPCAGCARLHTLLVKITIRARSFQLTKQSVSPPVLTPGRVQALQGIKVDAAGAVAPESVAAVERAMAAVERHLASPPARRASPGAHAGARGAASSSPAPRGKASSPRTRSSSPPVRPSTAIEQVRAQDHSPAESVPKARWPVSASHQGQQQQQEEQPELQRDRKASSSGGSSISLRTPRPRQRAPLPQPPSSPQRSSGSPAARFEGLGVVLEADAAAAARLAAAAEAAADARSETGSHATGDSEGPASSDGVGDVVAVHRPAREQSPSPDATGKSGCAAELATREALPQRREGSASPPRNAAGRPYHALARDYSPPPPATQPASPRDFSDSPGVLANRTVLLQSFRRRV